MLSQRLIESEDFSLDSQIMHAASSQPEPLGWPGSGFSRQPGTIAAVRAAVAAVQAQADRQRLTRVWLSQPLECAGLDPSKNYFY